MRKPIACCLHEIAYIIGQERAEKELFPVLETILSDSSESMGEMERAALTSLMFAFVVDDEVKQGAIMHLTEFI